MAVSAADIEKSIKGINFPASKNDLVNTARQHKAQPDVITTLEHLPERTYNTAVDVSKAFGELKQE
ncbi:MAG: DUF2795 domain-containing protein [bacterium]